MSQSEVDKVKEAIFEIEEARALDGEHSSLEDLPDIDLDGGDSWDAMLPGRYSRLESERKVDPRPVLSTANCVKETSAGGLILKGKQYLGTGSQG